MATETIPFDAAKYLDTPEAQADLVADAFETGDASYIAAALGAVVRVSGLTKEAKDADATREALYEALSADGDPKLSTLLGVMRALDLSIRARPAPQA